MSQNEPLIPANAQALEQPLVSPTITGITQQANQGANDIVNRFKSEETSLVRPILLNVNAYIGYMLGKQANPTDYSRIVSLVKQVRAIEATNDALYKKEA